MQPDMSFEASFVPRFQGDKDEQRQIENFCAQLAFWSSVQELLSTKNKSEDTGPIVEIRLIAEPSDRRSRITVNVNRAAAVMEAISGLAYALPPDYGWQAFNSSDIFETDNTLLPSKWYFARIERRINFIDLPSRRLDTMDTSGAQDSARVGSKDSAWNVLDDQRRRLITPFVSRGELESERFCLPVVGVLENRPRSLRMFFQELRNRAPCVVSIAIAPVDSSRLDSYRRIAMFWNSGLQSFDAEIANAGFANLVNLQSQYHRFLLPDRFLCVMTMRVAASTKIAAKSLALHLSARLGGLRSFTIINPVESPLDNIGNPWLSVPHRAVWPDEWWNSRLDRLRREMAQDGIEENDGDVKLLEHRVFKNFLIELPHLYTIDEASIIAALPVADEEGLPGLDTRLIAPFSEPSRSGACPVKGPWPHDRIRIGLSTARSNATAVDDTNVAVGSEWHTISKMDLTKHAFIVGSTGSGKTITTLFLVRELARLKVPFLIIEPVKTEYYEHLKKIPGITIKRVRLEGTSEGKQVSDFLAFDPMRLQEGVSVARHASYLKSCFEAAFPMPPDSAESMILEAGIRSYYLEKKCNFGEKKCNFGCGLEMFSRGGSQVHRIYKYLKYERPLPPDPTTGKLRQPEQVTCVVKHDQTVQKGHNIIENEVFVSPSLKEFRRFFNDTFLPQVASAEGSKVVADLLFQWQQYFKRRFEALSTGMIGCAAREADQLFLKDPTNYDPFSKLLETSTIVELDGIPDNEQKALMMGFITTFLFERRQAEDLKQRERQEAQVTQDERKSDTSMPDSLKHVLFLEEAHRILANSQQSGRGDAGKRGSQAKSVSLFVDMLAEIRAFGQGLVIIEQIPTKIVPEAVKNTNLKIMLRLTAADDREFLGSAMNFTEEQKRFVTSLRAEEGRGIDMVIFEQQLDQPRLLTLPLPAAREVPIHNSLFEQNKK